jgi:membrane protein
VFLVLASPLGWIPTFDPWDKFADWITTYFPWLARGMVLTTMIQLSQHYAELLSFGSLATVWSASSGFLSLMEAQSIAHGVPDERSYVGKSLIAIATTIAAALFVLLSFALWNLGHLLVATVVLEIYLAYGSNVSALYGAAGFIVLMLWIYRANLMLLIGAETDTALRELKLAGS